MFFNFLHRPEARKYNYKPQFYVPREEKPINYDKYDPNDFGKRLHNGWEGRRRTKNNSTNNIRAIIWIAFLLLVLLFVGWRFLFKF